jgi:hypothetical protein
MKLCVLPLILSLFPVVAQAGGVGAAAIEGDWVGCLANAEAESTGALALMLQEQSNRRAGGPLALGLPGFEGVEFGELELTISGSGVVSGVAHSELLAYDDVEVQAQLVFHGEYLEDTGAIIGDATLHLAGLGGETLSDADYQRYFGGADMGSFYGKSAGSYFGGHDLGEYFGGVSFGGHDLGEYLGGLDLGGLFDDLDLGRSDLGGFLIDRSVGGYFGGHDLGEYFGVETFGGHDLGEYFGVETFGGHDLGEYFGGHDLGEYFTADNVTWDDLGIPTKFGGHDLGEYLTRSFVKRFVQSTPPSVELDQGGSVDFVLMLVPAEG